MAEFGLGTYIGDKKGISGFASYEAKYDSEFSTPFVNGRLDVEVKLQATTKPLRVEFDPKINSTPKFHLHRVFE